jgi:hypothetical protein
MTAPLTLQAIARQQKIAPFLRKPGLLQLLGDVSGSVPSFEDSHLEPETRDAHETSDWT